MDLEERAKLLTRALAEGFFMNTARRVPHHSKEGAYLTVHEGLMVKLDRSSVLSTLNEHPDWLIYTELSSTMSGASGLMKLASELHLPWVEDLIPRLKEVNVKSLCGILEDLPEKQ